MAPVSTYIFFGLNIVRVLSIVSLLLVFASSIFVMVNDVEAVNTYQSAKQSLNATEAFVNCDYIEGSTVPNQLGGAFWAIVNRLLIIFQVTILLMSEFGWPAVFFDRFFPVLGTGFGLGALGIFQGFIGAAVLSQHVDDFTFVAAFFLFVVGCLNMLLGLIFRESAKDKRSIFSWRHGKTDALPVHLPPATGLSRSSTAASASSQSTAPTTYEEKPRDLAEFGARVRDRTQFGFGRQGEKAAGMQGFLISKPLETLPRYAARPRTGSGPSSRSASPAPPQFASSGTAI